MTSFCTRLAFFIPCYMCMSNLNICTVWSVFFFFVFFSPHACGFGASWPLVSAQRWLWDYYHIPATKAQIWYPTAQVSNSSPGVQPPHTHHTHTHIHTVSYVPKDVLCTLPRSVRISDGEYHLKMEHLRFFFFFLVNWKYKLFPQSMASNARNATLLALAESTELNFTVSKVT